MRLCAPKKIVLIGASTGGPGQIEKIILSLEKLNGVTMVIAQHMAIGFTASFAKRLQEHSKNQVSVIHDNERLESGRVYLSCGHTSLYKNANALMFSQSESPQNGFNPDINVLFNSFLPFTENFEILSVILTGIGNDGVEACKSLSEQGSSCLTESQKSAIVDGMPSRARKEVKNIKVQEMNEIVQTIKEFCG